MINLITFQHRISRLLFLAVIVLPVLALSARPVSAQAPALSDYGASDDATTVSYHFSYSGSYDYYRVYIDADRQSGTGFATGGIGADYLLEGANLFVHSGIGSGWDWQWKASVTFSMTDERARWTVQRADIGRTLATDVIFQVEAPLVSSAPYLYVYSSSPAAVSPAPISDERATNDNARVFYHFSYSGSYDYYRVYIDADRQSGTGFATGGIGADYLLEGANLFVHSGTGSGWDWQVKQAVAFSNADRQVEWAVARADIGNTAATDLIFQVESPLISSPLYHHVYTGPAIYDGRASNDDTHLSYQFIYQGSYDYYRVYIDTDRQAATGFATGGIGADYLLEGANLFVHSGIGSGWDWQWKGAATYSNSSQAASWTLDRELIGETSACDETSKIVFQAEGATLETGPPVSQQYLTGSSCTQQKMAVPAYFGPGTLWHQMEHAAPTTGLAVINPNNGPGASLSLDYAAQVDSTRANGIMVLGYVSTSWAGTLVTSRTLDAAKADIDAYYRWYPDIDGIFLDETPPECGARYWYYQELYSYIKAKGGLAKVVLNPGKYDVQECYMSVGDIILNFEGTYSEYQTWQLEEVAWQRTYSANRFWHLVYETDDTAMPAAIERSKQNNAGWVYVTADKLDNPWDTLPTSTYWIDELRLIAAQ